MGPRYEKKFVRKSSTFRQLLTNQPLMYVFWFLVCYAATQLATQAQQRRIQVVRSNKVARERLTKSNGTPAMDLGHFNVV